MLIVILAPDVVIYDYACGLHNYCLNREAKFFKHTKFLIDRYHQPNHKGEFNCHCIQVFITGHAMYVTVFMVYEVTT